MTHALEIDRVSLGYPQGGAVKTVLHDFDLAVRSGELVSLLGASGAGKSSLLRVLAGLKQALSGQVRLFGEPFSRPHLRVGLVFQSAALLPWLNVRDNVAFGFHAVIEATDAVQGVVAGLSDIGKQGGREGGGAGFALFSHWF